MPATRPEIQDHARASGEAAALALDDVSLVYTRGLFRAHTSVLQRVSLRVPAGARIGLIGPNGSGKSSLLRIAAGIQRQTSGCASAFGYPLEDERARERIGFLSDGSPFPPELSARYVLELFHRLHRLDRRPPREAGGGVRAQRRKYCDALLERAGLSSDAHRPLGTFSRGMLRRFGLAQAFLHEPDLVLLDEPTAGLDAPGHTVLETFLAEAQARGAALLLASHIPSDLLAFTDHVAVLVEGTITRQGPPETLLAQAGRGMAALFNTHASNEEVDEDQNIPGNSA